MVLVIVETLLILLRWLRLPLEDQYQLMVAWSLGPLGLLDLFHPNSSNHNKIRRKRTQVENVGYF